MQTCGLVGKGKNVVLCMLLLEYVRFFSRGRGIHDKENQQGSLETVDTCKSF